MEEVYFQNESTKKGLSSLWTCSIIWKYVYDNVTFSCKINLHKTNIQLWKYFEMFDKKKEIFLSTKNCQGNVLNILKIFYDKKYFSLFFFCANNKMFVDMKIHLYNILHILSIQIEIYIYTLNIHRISIIFHIKWSIW